jgi:hypothetical protein
MGKLNVSKQVKYISLDWRFPMSMYSIMEDDCNMIYIELMKGVQLPPEYIVDAKVLPSGCNMIYIELMKGVQLPPEYIVDAKVLPGGMQFSLLVGVPCCFYEESYIATCRLAWVETTAPDWLFFGLLTAPSSSRSAGSSPELQIPLKELPKSSTLMRSVLRALFLTTLAMPAPAPEELSRLRRPNSTRVP